MAKRPIGPTETDLADPGASLELSSNNTALGFERTGMAADRTLMAIVRTSLSLISFGFTIHTAFQKFAESATVPIRHEAARNFGMALILIGLAMLAMGVASHMKFQRQLTERHDRLFDMKLVHHRITYRATPTFIIALLLGGVGVVAFGVVALSAIRGE